MPYDEEIIPGQFKDRALIESAAGRPFHVAFGVELWPTLPEKAAALFHSLSCNHCFFNGNKRTAVIALDLFLALNGHILAMTADEVYVLSKRTASANAEGRTLESVMAELSAQIGGAAVSFEALEALESSPNSDQLPKETRDKILHHVRSLRAGMIKALEKMESVSPSVDSN